MPLSNITINSIVRVTKGKKMKTLSATIVTSLMLATAAQAYSMYSGTEYSCITTQSLFSGETEPITLSNKQKQFYNFTISKDTNTIYAGEKNVEYKYRSSYGSRDIFTKNIAKENGEVVVIDMEIGVGRKSNNEFVQMPFYIKYYNEKGHRLYAESGTCEIFQLNNLKI